MNKLKQTNAITLIALIITIIVLLILAGVVINMTLGNEGIIAKAQAGVDTYQNAQEKEKYEIAKAANEIDNIVNGNRNDSDAIAQLRQEIELLKAQSKMKSPIHVFNLVLGQKARTTGNYVASTNLNTVDNTFIRTNDENFNNYFSFEAEKGWTVKKSGLYHIKSGVWAYKPENKRQDIESYIKVNSNYFYLAHDSSTKEPYVYDCDDITIYLEKDNTIDFIYEILNENATNSYACYDIYAMYE